MADEICRCLCHTKGSFLLWRQPEMSDPVEALVACDLCAILHAGVWRVVPRGYRPPPREPWSSQGDGEGAE